MTTSDSLWSTLEGAELESVVFVRDYLQLNFYSSACAPRLSCYVWPVLTVNRQALACTDPGYRDALCDLIGESVWSACESQDVGLHLIFSSGVMLEIGPSLADVDGPEIALLDLCDTDQSSEMWRHGEGLFRGGTDGVMDATTLTPPRNP